MCLDRETPLRQGQRYWTADTVQLEKSRSVTAKSRLAKGQSTPIYSFFATLPPWTRK